MTKVQAFGRLTLINQMNKISCICNSDPDHDWPRTHQDYQFHILWDRRIWVSFPSSSAWIHSVFFIEDEKGSILIRHYGRQANMLQSLEHSKKLPPTKDVLVFVQIRKYQPRWYRKLTEKPLAPSIPMRSIYGDENQTPSPLIVFGVATSEWTLWLHSSSHMTSDSLSRG